MTPSSEIALGCLAVFALAGGLAALLVRWALRVRDRSAWPLRTAALALAAGLGCVSLLAGIWAGLLLGVPLVYDRGSVVAEPAPGFHYRREFRSRPRPHLVHTVAVDLEQPGLELLWTRPRQGDPDGYAAQRTSDFARAQGAIAAINASFFHPFHSEAPWDYYPHTGDRVEALGLYGRRGSETGRPWHGAHVFLSGARAEFFGALPAAPGLVVEGRHRLLAQGKQLPLPTDLPYSRMALGLRGRQLVAVAVDGKLDGLAEGLTLRELAALLLSLGLEDAIELDGGGSTTLVLRERSGEYRVLNLTSHTRIPFRERPVATHLGFRLGS